MPEDTTAPPEAAVLLLKEAAMYGYEYEFDFLLCLRLLKFLHMQSPESAKRVIEIYKEVDTEKIGIVM